MSFHDAGEFEDIEGINNLLGESECGWVQLAVSSPWHGRDSTPQPYPDLPQLTHPCPGPRQPRHTWGGSLPVVGLYGGLNIRVMLFRTL